MTVNWIGIHLTRALLTELPNSLLMGPRRIAFYLTFGQFYLIIIPPSH